MKLKKVYLEKPPDFLLTLQPALMITWYFQYLVRLLVYCVLHCSKAHFLRVNPAITRADYENKAGALPIARR